MIYLISYAKGGFPPRDAQPMIYWGYHTSETEAQHRVDSLNAEGYSTWRSNTWAGYLRAREDSLYPELLAGDDNDLLVELFRHAADHEPDLSEETYRESGQASLYSVLPIASANDSTFDIPSI